MRATVAITSLIQGAVSLVASNNPALGTRVVGLFAVASGVSLLFGFLTPVAGVLAGIGSVGIALSWFPAPIPNVFDAKLSVVFMAIMATAIVFLGPGAFSLDSRLFGRREIIIPPASRLPES
ncbi:MAG: hypothetical protein ACREEM_22740 [Blastocatellia bacterium]